MFNTKKKNQVPLFETDQIDQNNETILKWQSELSKSQEISNSPPKSTQQLDTSLILASHKIIPAHVSGMVPFGMKKN